MTYCPRQHSPHARQTAIRASAASSLTRSFVVLGIRGTSGPSKSRARPIPFLEQPSTVLTHSLPLAVAMYVRILHLQRHIFCFGIWGVNNRMCNLCGDASPGNFRTWKTKSVSGDREHGLSKRLCSAARTGGSRDATLPGAPRLPVLSFLKQNSLFAEVI